MADPKCRKVGDGETDCPPSGSGTANDADFESLVKALVEEVLKGQDARGSTSRGEKSSGVTMECMCPYLVDITRKVDGWWVSGPLC